MEKFFHKFLTILCRWALIIVIFTGSCGKDDEPERDNAPFEFFKVGNWWEYEKEAFDDKMELTHKWTKVKKITSIDGNFIYYNDVIDNLENEYVDDTLWGREKDFPFIFRDSYVGRKDKIYDILTLEVISINEPVIVPAGTFHNCIKVKLYTPSYYKGESAYCIYSYISKKYGLIMEQGEYGDGSSYIIKLKSYNIK